MTNQLRGISALIPTARTDASPGARAASPLLHLRTDAVPVPVLAAALELIAPALEDSDPVTREAAAAVHARLAEALDQAATGHQLSWA
ncbi:hypothetical protein KCMC57_up63130 [Kitasatospora sp. CMC57]|uniref:Uncharacterized protein n=1 Tax=Kitasatospora sp. CMC57 TaxID=3231513 RepID=A0AB33K7R8_9ACTN